MASAGNGGGGGGVGALKRSMGPLRLQYYIVMGAVAAAVVLATLRYMPGPAIPATATAGSSATTTSGGGGAVVRSAPAAAAEVEDEEQAQEGTTTATTKKKRRKKGDGLVLFNFGDSNSDTGGVAAVMGIRIAPPEGRAYFHHPTGRLSDGRVILDFICEFKSPLLFPIPPTSIRFDSTRFRSILALLSRMNSPRPLLGRLPSRFPLPGGDARRAGRAAVPDILPLRLALVIKD